MCHGRTPDTQRFCSHARFTLKKVARLLLASGADAKNAKVSIASGCRMLQPPLSG